MEYKARFFILTLMTVNLFALSAHAGPVNFTYEGVLADSNDEPLSGQNASVEVSIVDSNSTACILYRETHSVTTDNSGKFVIKIGAYFNSANGSGKYSSASFQQIFSGDSGLNGENSCVSNSGTRNLKIAINGVDLTPNLALTSTPYSIHANNADKLSNYFASQVLKSTNAGQFNTDLSDLQVTEFYALITGTSTSYVKPGSAAFTSQPTYSGTPSAASDLTNKAYVDAAVSAGLPSVGTAGTYTKVTTDAQGRVTSGVATLTAGDIPNLDAAKITTGSFADSMLSTISTAGKVSGSAITSGTIAGSTVFNSSGAVTAGSLSTAGTLAAGNTTISGNITASGTATANTISGNQIRAYYGGNYIELAASSGLSSTISFKLPTADGTSGQVLQTDGSGNLSWITPSGGGGGVSSVTGAAPIVSSGGTCG